MVDQVMMLSFSIVLETENLATADLAGLLKSIACLAGQDLPPTQANEVLLVDSGDLPPDMAQQLIAEYPWLTLHRSAPNLNYYEAKMLGASLATGEVVVYYDSDCLYEPQWLRSLLTGFTDPQVQVVAGETRTRGIGLYGTAMALAYIFPPYSEGETGLQPGAQYYLNNVAFRRSFLLDHPIPIALPLYRGNCVIHAKQLVNDGVMIWRQPQARATHAPPHGIKHFIRRFLLIGYDYYWQQQLLGPFGKVAVDPTMNGWQGKLKVLDDRLGRLVRSNPWHLFFLPFSVPVILFSVLLILLGYLITKRQPAYLFRQFSDALPSGTTHPT
jgi:glycosyltransferase involved in cell wall biosynthesis